MDKRVRTTAATLRADKKMRDIIELLSDRQPISVCDLGAIMELSSPGIRKYCYRLISAGIVKQHCDDNRQSFITLTATPEALATYMAAFNTPEPPQQSVLDLPEPVDPARRRHIMADDMKYNVKIDAEVPARRDDLVAALFGPAPAAQIVTVLELA